MRQIKKIFTHLEDFNIWCWTVLLNLFFYLVFLNSLLCRLDPFHSIIHKLWPYQVRWFDCILIWSSSTHLIHSRRWCIHWSENYDSIKYDDLMSDWFDLPKLTTFIAEDHIKDVYNKEDIHTFGNLVDFVLNGIVLFDWMIWSSWVDYNWGRNTFIPSYPKCEYIK